MILLKARIIGFRRGRHTLTPNYALVEVEGAKNKSEAAKLVGKKVVWKSSPTKGKVAKKIVGKITAPHGGKGVVRALFGKGLPGQAVGQEVELLG